MSFACLHVSGKLTEQPLTVHNGTAAIGTVSDRLGRAYDRAGYLPFDVVDGVAVISISGALVQDGAWVDAPWGETSYQVLRMQVARAASNNAIKAVVFEVNSFGGLILDAFETAAAIAQLSKLKPTIAIGIGYIYSAAYLLASQARQITLPEFGWGGSIGAAIRHDDYSRNLDADGVTVTLVRSGERKLAVNPFEPLPDEERAVFQADVDAARNRFAEVVGKARGKRFTKAQALSTQGRTFRAADALDLGLIDAVGDGQEAFAAFVKEVNRK